jgi:hypothetical protein
MTVPLEELPQEKVRLTYAPYLANPDRFGISAVPVLSL